MIPVTEALRLKQGRQQALEMRLGRLELTYTGRGLGSDDGEEAVCAILEKRKPVFSGR